MTYHYDAEAQAYHAQQVFLGPLVISLPDLNTKDKLQLHLTYSHFMSLVFLSQQTSGNG